MSPFSDSVVFVIKEVTYCIFTKIDLVQSWYKSRIPQNKWQLRSQVLRYLSSRPPTTEAFRKGIATDARGSVRVVLIGHQMCLIIFQKHNRLSFLSSFAFFEAVWLFLANEGSISLEMWVLLPLKIVSTAHSPLSSCALCHRRKAVL